MAAHKIERLAPATSTHQRPGARAADALRALIQMMRWRANTITKP